MISDLDENVGTPALVRAVEIHDRMAGGPGAGEVVEYDRIRIAR